MKRPLLKRSLVLLAAVTVVSTIMVQLLTGGHSSAFTASNLIDDAVFDNTSTMSIATIDSFLNSFPSSCISTNHGFTAPVPTGYSPGGGFTYGPSVSAGKVIYDSAAVYGLNPQVLLATLQKEQSLVVGDAGCSVLRYAGAAGYGCPDGGTTYSYSGVNLYSINGSAVTSVSGTCVNSSLKVGFSQQVIRAAWLLKFGQQRSRGNISWAVITGSWNNSDDPQTCYGGPMTTGTYQVCPGGGTTFYDGYKTIDGQATHMDSGATAALYWYTPHFHGNQNFDSIFISWFGSVSAADYSWSYAGISISGGTWDVQGNTQKTVTLYAKNTGHLAWSNTNFPVRLGAFRPTGHSSLFYDPSWVSPTRPATLNESTVEPGDTGSFTFNIHIPNQDGHYGEHFNLVAEGATWMNDADFTLGANITRTNYAWQLVSYMSSNGFNLAPGQTSQITLIAKNNSNVTWTNTGNAVRLATWYPTNRTSPFCSGSTAWVVDCNRPAVLQESSVAPGANGTFVFTVQAPATPGFYVERVNLVMEGISWFNDPWVEFDFNVGNFYKWQLVSYTSSNGFNLAAGQTSSITMTAKNTGNVTWNNSSTPVRVATWFPSYRTSVFNPNDSSWPSATRIATLTNGTVAPNANGTFTFTVKAPTRPGFYVERVNLVMEGMSWFEDPWVEFDFTVH